MLVGCAGSGKTVIVGDQIASLPENYAVINIPLNYYTTSEMLQQVLEKPLEKKAGRNYGPPGSKHMIYFIDDMNMPEVVSSNGIQIDFYINLPFILHCKNISTRTKKKNNK